MPFPGMAGVEIYGFRRLARHDERPGKLQGSSPRMPSTVPPTALAGVAAASSFSFQALESDRDLRFVGLDPAYLGFHLDDAKTTF
jgi:hypothetical protein